MDRDDDRTIDEELAKDLEPSEEEQEAVAGGAKKNDNEIPGSQPQHNETLLTC